MLLLLNKNKITKQVHSRLKENSYIKKTLHYIKSFSSRFYPKQLTNEGNRKKKVLFITLLWIWVFAMILAVRNRAKQSDTNGLSSVITRIAYSSQPIRFGAIKNCCKNIH